MQKNQNYYIQLAVYTTRQILIMYIIYVTIKIRMEKNITYNWHTTQVHNN